VIPVVITLPALLQTIEYLHERCTPHRQKEAKKDNHANDIEKFRVYLDHHLVPFLRMSFQPIT